MDGLLGVAGLVGAARAGADSPALTGVAGLLGAKRAAHDGAQLGRARASSQRVAQRHLRGAEQAHLEHAGRMTRHPRELVRGIVRSGAAGAVP